MKGSRKMVSEERKPQFLALLTGVLIGYAITCIIFIGYSILITYSSMQEGNLSLVVAVTSLISVIVAGFDAGRASLDKGWLWGILAGVLYFFVLITIGTWVNKGLYIDTRTLTLLLLSLAGGGLGGIIGINFRK